MKKSAIICIAAVMSLILSGCGEKYTVSQVYESKDETDTLSSLSQEKKNWLDELDKVEEVICNFAGAFDYANEDEWKTQYDIFDVYIQTEMIEEKSEIFFELRKMLASLKCSAVTVEPIIEGNIYLGLLPVNTSWIGNDLVISATTENFKNYIGYRVTDICGKPVNEIVDEYSKIVPCATEASKKLVLDGNTYWKSEMQYLNLVTFSDNEAEFTLVSPSGEEVKAMIPFQSEKKLSYNLGTLFENEEDMPIGYRYLKSEKPFLYKYDEEKNSVYFQYNTDVCDGDALDDTFGYMIQQIQSTNCSKLIIDLRWNNSFERDSLRKLFEKEKSVLNGIQICLLTGINTSVNGLAVVEDCYELFINVHTFGDKTAIPIHSYTGSKKTEFPILGIEISTPLSGTLFTELSSIYPDTKDSLIPSVIVEENIDDFFNGRDAVYDSVFSDEQDIFEE